MAGAPKVTFESLFCVFEFFGASGSVGALPGHNASDAKKKFFNSNRVAHRIARFGPLGLRIGSHFHLRTPALKAENFSKKIGRFSKHEKWIY